MTSLSPPYKAILADPPWRFETWTPKGRDRCPGYRPSLYNEIAKINIQNGYFEEWNF